MSHSKKTVILHIDNSVFMSENYRFDKLPLSFLGRLVSSGRLQFVSTEISEAEVWRGIGKHVDESKGHINRALQRSYQLPQDIANGLMKFRDGLSVDELWANYQSLLRPKILKIESSCLKKVVQDFRRGDPPFGNPKKPSEFADALTGQVLFQHCLELNESRHVLVTKDRDFDFIKKTKIEVFDSLSEFIQSLMEGSQETLVLHGYSKFENELRTEILSLVEGQDFRVTTNDVESDIDGVSGKELILEHIYVEDSDEHSVSGTIEYSVEVLVQLTTTTSLWDSVDRERVEFGSRSWSTTVGGHLLVDFAALFDEKHDCEDFQILDLSLGECEIEVDPQLYEPDFDE